MSDQKPAPSPYMALMSYTRLLEKELEAMWSRNEVIVIAGASFMVGAFLAWVL